MRRPLFIISVFLICLMQSAYALEVSHLKTMAYRNPIGIDVVEPTFRLSRKSVGIIRL